MADKEEQKNIEIANEVVAIIAGLAATEVPGVAGMSGGIAGGFAEILGRKNLTKGVEVETDETKATINLYIIVDYGVSIPEVAENIQRDVKNAIEQMTGLKTEEIYIHIQGVEFNDDDENKLPEEKTNS